MQKRKRKDPTRPFHIWNSKTLADEPHRHYEVIENAHMGALYLAYWTKERNIAFEVYDSRTMKLIVQIVRTPTGIKIIEE